MDYSSALEYSIIRSYTNIVYYYNASNSDLQQANRIQTFKISDNPPPNKDVVSLIPVQKMTAHNL